MIRIRVLPGNLKMAGDQPRSASAANLSVLGRPQGYEAMPKSFDLHDIVSIVLTNQKAAFACAYSPFLPLLTLYLLTTSLS